MGIIIVRVPSGNIRDFLWFRDCSSFKIVFSPSFPLLQIQFAVTLMSSKDKS